MKAKYGRYNALGRIFSGRLLSVIFEYKREGVIRVITARDMTRKEIGYFKRRIRV
ncbi:BrnT family toxin [Candidatus Poribacteria bacterium]|nr:BrnT family toxin [Candidatus Poribacteria bacterium]